MSKQQAIWLVITVIMVSVRPLSASPLTNVWSFTAPFQYVVADSPTIEVADGAARLQLQSNRWVAPATGYGCPFLGNLLGFTHLLATNNNDAEVRYQISGNNGTNWYAWVDDKWNDVSAYTNSVTSWQFANEVTVIHANIGLFYSQLYASTGGVFKFKAFLSPDAVTQIALEEVRLIYATGRIVVSVPNGGEVGPNSWLKGVPYTVQWTSAGKVGSKVELEYSLDSGTTWNLIATNVANVTGMNNYANWTTPITISDKCRVRVKDMEDATISDLSDSDFVIGANLQLSVPNGGEKWYTGRTNTVQWESPYNLGGQK